MASTMEAPIGPLELLVVQPTPYCNLNCSYCYLPDRTSRKKMPEATLRQTFAWPFANDLVRRPFTVLWHAGEPLIVPIRYYERAIRMLDDLNSTGHRITHSMQTNGTLITPEWCKFFKDYDVHVGVSLDGPKFLHDANRRSWTNQGSHEKTVKGIELLNQFDVPFNVLAVVTAATLDYPDELFDHLLALGVSFVGLNCEEIEGPNTRTSLAVDDAPTRLKEFFARFVELAYSVDPPLLVREVEDGSNAINQPFLKGMRTQVNRPWSILNVDCEGNFGTYSPELLGIKSERYGDFRLGNVFTDTLASVLRSHRYQTMEQDIQRGIERCQTSCQYFRFCGGGPPGNKYFEKGTFDCDQTLSCRLQMQIPVDVTLDYLENREPPHHDLAERDQTRVIHFLRLPDHLMNEWWQVLSKMGPGNQHEFRGFLDKLTRFLRFKRLGVPRGSEATLLTFPSGTARGHTYSLNSLAQRPAWLLLNMGLDDITLQFRDVNSDFEMVLTPGEGVTLPENVRASYDSSTKDPALILKMSAPASYC